MGHRPKLKSWQTNLLATGIPERSVAPDFESVFTSFYLASDTYLGQLCCPTDSAGESRRNDCCPA